MRNFIFIICFFFSGYVVFSQTYRATDGTTLIRSGSSITVKWTNANNNVVTKKAVCGAATYQTFMGVQIEYRTCNCTGSSDYFKATFNNDLLGRPLATIEYYNELGSMYWKTSDMYQK